MGIRSRSRRHTPAVLPEAAQDRLAAIRPAPTCRPAPRSVVTVAVPGWGPQLLCRTVRMDPESNELLLVLPDHLDWAPHAKKGVVVRIGWPDHAAWHESLAHFSAAMPARSPFLRLVVGGVPVHHERRRHLRVPMTRKVQVLSRGQALLATTINVSEAAMRTVLPVHNSPCSGDAVTVTLRLTSRHTEEVRTVAFDGRILRSAELSGARAGSKEIVVLYATATPAQEDAVRGLVFELGLQERIAQEAEGSLVGP